MAVETIEKCPACGAIRDSYAAVCGECGYTFRNVENSQSIQVFADKIEEYDRQIIANEPEKSGAGFWTILGWIFLFPIMLGYYIFKKAKSAHEELEGYEKLKSEAIMNFPIPNSKNDLLEFSIFVESRVKPINYMNALSKSGTNVQKWNKIWQSKAEQIHKKAQLALNEDRSALTPVSQNYQAVIEKYKRNEKIQWTMIAVLAAAFIVFLVLACVSQ